MEEPLGQNLPEEIRPPSNQADDAISDKSQPVTEQADDTISDQSRPDADFTEIESSPASGQKSDSVGIETVRETGSELKRGESESSRWARRKENHTEGGKPKGTQPDEDDDEIESSREVHSERERSDQGSPRHPFNNQKHAPTRPEIDILLGVSPSAELRRFEHQLELMEPMINWAMQWYENEIGWGFRASYHARVLCVLHFYRGFFTVTLSIPITDIERYHSLKELTPGLRKAFDYFTHSTKMKWFTFHVRTSKEVRAVLALLELKLEDLKRKTNRG
jgi:hypothetical protein